jgi:hypothetical protein
VTDEPIDVVVGGERKDCLAERRAVRRHAAADAGRDVEVATAHLVEVDDVEPVQYREVHGLARRLVCVLHPHRG